MRAFSFASIFCGTDAINLTEQSLRSMSKKLLFAKSCVAYLFFANASLMPILAHAQAIITTLGSPFPMYNGNDLSAWQRSGNQNGNASWQLSDKEISVTQGHGLLVSRLSVPDFELEFDYWVSDKSLVTVFFRCANPGDITSETADEVSLVNQGNGVGAGSISLLSNMKSSKVSNQWNHIKISAIGTQIMVTLNGVTNQVRDTRFSSGPIAINYSGGELRLKNIYVTIPGRW